MLPLLGEINRLENTDTTTYIYDINDLIEFRDSVNAGNDYAGKTVYVMADIDMSRACSETVGSWTPIGTYVDEEGNNVYFAGTFDGNYHELSNLYYYSDSYTYAGLFAQNNGIIQNVMLDNVYIYAQRQEVKDTTRVGGIVGQNNGNIINCGINNGSVNLYKEAVDLYVYLGGITGYNQGEIYNCYNKANITSKVNNSINNYGTGTGGIAGRIEDGGIIENCYNAGNIKSIENYGNVGGILGILSKGILKNSYSIGSVTNGREWRIGAIVGIEWGYNVNPINKTLINSYCGEGATYSYYYIENGVQKTSNSGKVSPTENLKTYSSTLGSAFENDNFNINNGYPILKWQAPAEINLNVRQEYIKIGEKLQLNNIAVNSDGACIEGITNNYFTWTSSNEDVATVDENGVVTGAGVGHATITAYNEELGIKQKAIINVYRNVESAVTIPQVEIGDGFTVVLKEDGTVWGAGNNDSGQLGDGTTNNRNTLEQVKIDENTYLTNIIKIDVTASNNIVALTKDGQLYGWGKNSYGCLATGDTSSQKYAYKMNIDNKRIIDISSGSKNTYILADDGKIYGIGVGDYNALLGSPTTYEFKELIEISNVIKLVSDDESCIVLQSDGKAYGWGYDNWGELGQGNFSTSRGLVKVGEDIVNISVGTYATIIEKEDGNFYTAGINNWLGNYGGLGIGSSETRITTFTKIEIPGLKEGTRKIVSAKRIGFHTILLASDGTVWVAGNNESGQISTGNSTSINTFVQMKDNETTYVTDALLIGEGETYGDGRHTKNSGIIRTDGTVWISGDNTYGQIGNGTNDSTNYLTKMEYIYLDYEDKIVEVDEKGYRLDLNKLKYLYSTMNVFNDKNNEEAMSLGEIKFTSLDTNIATINETGRIVGQVPTGEVQIKIEDVTNGYETYITAIIKSNRLQNTDTVEYIYTIEDLVAFRDSVNAGNDYARKTVYVMADIDMSPVCSATLGSWTPIGTDTTIFAGTFDGNYHKLINLYYNSNTYENVGLFAQNNGTIQDLILENVDIYANKTGVNDTIRAGGIVGISRGNITNCGINSGSITVHNNTKLSSGWRVLTVGGIVGSSAGNVMNCYNKANIIGVNYYNKYTGTQAGGIIGAGSKVTNCYNTGNINATAKNAYAGGISGDASTGKNIINSYSIGSSTSNAGAFDAAGGIIGLNRGNDTVTNSYCGAGTKYSQRYDNSAGYQTAGRIDPTELLKTYAPILGSAYENDDFNINDGYPILWWEAPTIELNKKQAYVKTGEKLQLEVVGAPFAGIPEGHDTTVPANVEITDFEWKSTNEDVATVDENGIVTGVSEGYTTIYGTYKYNNTDEDVGAGLASARIHTMCIVNVAGKGNTATPQIETGNGFTVILKADGTVWMTGNSDIIATGTGRNITKNTDIATNDNLDVVGAIINRPLYGEPAQIKINETEYLTNVIKISAGPNHILALTKDGEVYAWGQNTNGQLGNNTTENSNYATLVTGEGGASTLKRIVDISVGANGSVAVNEFGWVYVWGNGTNGEMGNGSTTSSNTPVKTVISKGISASEGAGHVAVLGQNGKVYTWGKNNVGQLGINSTINNTVVGKIADGITDISTAGNETIVKDIEGNAYGTGQNTEGELGLGTNTNVTNLTKMTLPGTSNVKYIKAGSTNTTLMLSDGTVWSTGINTNGEIGNGANDNTNTFVQGMTNYNIVENQTVDAVGAHSVRPLGDILIIGRNNGLNTAVILENGDIYTTGSNTYGQICDGTNENTNYYKKMGYVYLDYEDKIIEVKETGYQLDLNKLKYIFNIMNVFNEGKEYELGEIKFTSLDESIATVDNIGRIVGKVPTGEVQIKIEDVTNGYETYITAIINRLQNTDTVEYIYTIHDLVKFRDTVNAGNDYAGKTVYVMADIDMSPACSETVGSWKPIGTDTTIFAGTFEGNYHKLSNLYYNSNSYSMVGLFARNNGTIQNVIMDNIDIYAYKAGREDSINVGGISAGNSGTIINCGINGGSLTGYNVTEILSTDWRSIVVGGVIGSMNKGKVINCYNKANMKAQNYISKDARTGAAAGGIVGYVTADGVFLENCYNTGNINAIAKNAYSGGVVGDTRRHKSAYYKEFL